MFTQFLATVIVAVVVIVSPAVYTFMDIILFVVLFWLQR